MTYLVLAGIVLAVWDVFRSPVVPRRPRKPKPIPVLKLLRYFLLEESLCPECVGPLYRGGVCGHCAADVRDEWDLVHCPRCKACAERLKTCKRCGTEWCIACDSNPTKCPKCNRRAK